MYDAAGREATGGCAERAIDLLQLIAPAREIRGEDRVRQLADTRREPVVCIMSGHFQYIKVLMIRTHQSWN
jgi:hypothetical protein